MVLVLLSGHRQRTKPKCPQPKSPLQINLSFLCLFSTVLRYCNYNELHKLKISNQPELVILCFAGKFRFDFRCLRIQKCLHANSDKFSRHSFHQMPFYAIFYILRRNLKKKTSRSERISHADSPLILLLTQFSLGHYMTNRTMVRSEERINDEVGAHKKRKTRISPISKPSNESWIIWLHEPVTGVC